MYALKALVPKCDTLIEHKVCKRAGIWANSNVNSRREGFLEACHRLLKGFLQVGKMFGELWSWDPYNIVILRAHMAHIPVLDCCLLSKQGGRLLSLKNHAFCVQEQRCVLLRDLTHAALVQVGHCSREDRHEVIHRVLVRGIHAEEFRHVRHDCLVLMIQLILNSLLDCLFGFDQVMQCLQTSLQGFTRLLLQSLVGSVNVLPSPTEVLSCHSRARV